MKAMTFDEFFALPPGTIFGQATGLPHQFSCGLYRKDASFPAIEGRDGDDAEPATVSATELSPFEDGAIGVKWFIAEGDIEDDHRFLVYEPADLDRLAGLIGRGPVAHEGGAEVVEVTTTDGQGSDVLRWTVRPNLQVARHRP